MCRERLQLKVATQALQRLTNSFTISNPPGIILGGLECQCTNQMPRQLAFGNRENGLLEWVQHYLIPSQSKF